MKSNTPKLKRKLTKIFNEYIRTRDKGLRCISCDKNIGTQAGHYLPTSLCPQPNMVFNPRNVNSQCSYCNLWLHGSQHDYARGLIEKYGKHIIEELEEERRQKTEPWGTFQYEVMIKHYKEKLCELQS